MSSHRPEPHAREGPHHDRPVPRSRSGVIGRRHPRTGTEPITAQSPLRLRLLLSGIFLPVFAAATVLFALWAAGSGADDTPGPGPLTAMAVVCGALALFAAVDLIVVRRRLRRERGAGRR
jgi:hypothetical protein